MLIEVFIMFLLWITQRSERGSPKGAKKNDSSAPLGFGFDFI